jgi:hypothetical protein
MVGEGGQSWIPTSEPAEFITTSPPERPAQDHGESHWSTQNHGEPHWSTQDIAERYWSAQDHAEQHWSIQDIAERYWSAQDHAEQHWSIQDRPGTFRESLAPAQRLVHIRKTIIIPDCAILSVWVGGKYLQFLTERCMYKENKCKVNQ